MIEDFPDWKCHKSLPGDILESCKWTGTLSKKRICVNFYECATLLDDFIEVPLQTRYIPFVAPSQLLAGLPRPLCCPQLRRCSFGPLLRKLGSRVAGKEGKDPRNCSSLSLWIFLSQIISLNLFSDRSQTPFCSAGNDLLLRLVMACHRGGSGSEGGFVLTKKISKCRLHYDIQCTVCTAVLYVAAW